MTPVRRCEMPRRIWSLRSFVGLLRPSALRCLVEKLEGLGTFIGDDTEKVEA